MEAPRGGPVHRGTPSGKSATGFCQSQRHIQRSSVRTTCGWGVTAKANKQEQVRTALPARRWRVMARGDDAMRDIRNDLLERADLAQDQIKDADVHFERMIQQLQNEHDASVADLKACLAMIAKLMEFEERHMASLSPDGPPPPLANPKQRLRRAI
jgi:hypothetical protein